MCLPWQTEILMQFEPGTFGRLPDIGFKHQMRIVLITRRDYRVHMQLLFNLNFWLILKPGFISIHKWGPGSPECRQTTVPRRHRKRAGSFSCLVCRTSQSPQTFLRSSIGWNCLDGVVNGEPCHHVIAWSTTCHRKRIIYGIKHLLETYIGLWCAMGFNLQSLF